MHELGIVYQVIKTVGDVMQEQGLAELDSITLEIGEMSDVVPAYIEQAWQSVKSTTPYPDAQIKTEIIPARAECMNCGYSDYVRNFDLECPRCKSSNLHITTGREFNIKQIVAK